MKPGIFIDYDLIKIKIMKLLVCMISFSAFLISCQNPTEKNQATKNTTVIQIPSNQNFDTTKKNITKEFSASAEKYNLLRLDDGTYALGGISGPELDNANKFLVGIILRGLSIQTMRSYGFDLVLIFKWLAEEKKEFEACKYNIWMPC